MNRAIESSRRHHVLSADLYSTPTRAHVLRLSTQKIGTSSVHSKMDGAQELPIHQFHGAGSSDDRGPVREGYRIGLLYSMAEAQLVQSDVFESYGVRIWANPTIHGNWFALLHACALNRATPLHIRAEKFSFSKLCRFDRTCVATTVHFNFACSLFTLNTKQYTVYHGQNTPATTGGSWTNFRQQAKPSKQTRSVIVRHRFEWFLLPSTTKARPWSTRIRSRNRSVTVRHWSRPGARL